MAKKIGIALGALLVAFLIFVAMRPNSFLVERSISVHAPAEKVFPLIDDFHNWSTWSPWEKLDPNLKRTHSGAQSGKGAVYEWQGNNQVGSGRMEVTQASPPSKVVIKLDFISPFEGHNVAEFTLAPQGDSTQLTWAMHGPSPYVSKLMGVFVSMDSLLGKDFEAGLANIKKAAEQ